MLTPPPESAPELGEAGQAPQRLAERQNLLQLVQLRWLAVSGQLATILGVRYLLDVPLPLEQMLTVLALLALFNLGSWWRTRWATPVTQAEVFAVLLVDVAVLTAQLYFAGGTTNPFIFLFLLQVVLGAMLLRRRYVWPLVMATVLAFVLLGVWHRPLQMPGLTLALPLEFTVGLLACFVLVVGLLVVFIGRVSRNLRQRDASLARLRQRAAEEEHIVRMGLLASGAAHELGTPLATLSVILGDWARMAPFAAEPELREEIEEMQRQIERCKTIVSGILTSAGESRAETPVATTLHTFLDGLVGRWEHTRGLALAYRRVGPDAPMIADTALQQMVDNVLDNAHEAAPNRPVALEALADGETLELRIQDRGPGFPPGMLERLGAPYQSSKGAPGRGLGLFLALNVARSLGGRLEGHNRPEGGAEVRITLPLAALAPQGKGRDGR